jgi:G3E family GTPase
VGHRRRGRHQVVDQIAFADRIVLNQVDLVGEEHVRALETRLRGINATAEIITSSHAGVDLTAVPGIGAFDLSHTTAVDPGWLDERDHHHDPGVASVSVELHGALDRAALEKLPGGLVERRGGDLYRRKGIVALDDHPRRFVLQGVHRRFELRPASSWGREPRTSKVVFIGRDPDRDELTGPPRLPPGGAGHIGAGRRVSRRDRCGGVGQGAGEQGRGAIDSLLARCRPTAR